MEYGNIEAYKSKANLFVLSVNIVPRITVIELYKIYGNDTTALVNPAENRFVLEVRDRGYEVNRLNDQI